MRVTKRFDLEAAHRITQHGGKCRSFHGHRYAIEVTFNGNVGDMDMVVDFDTVKANLGAWINGALDHGAILNVADMTRVPVYAQTEGGVAPHLVAGGGMPVPTARLYLDNGWKVYEVNGEPTAELIAAEVFRVAAMLFGTVRHHTPDGDPYLDHPIDNVRVYETPTCWADVSHRDVGCGSAPANAYPHLLQVFEPGHQVTEDGRWKEVVMDLPGRGLVGTSRWLGPTVDLRAGKRLPPTHRAGAVWHRIGPIPAPTAVEYHGTAFPRHVETTAAPDRAIHNDPAPV